MKVVDWISYEASEGMPESIGSMGGWVHGQGWEEYMDRMSSEDKYPYYEALRDIIVKDSIRCGGDEHQARMVPVFDDGTVGRFSYRAWGDLMAAIWNTEEKTRKYCYLDFYMSCLVNDSISSEGNEYVTETEEDDDSEAPEEACQGSTGQAG